MNYKIDKNSKVPAYLQLYQYLRNDIIKGIYPYGSRLPSKRIIAGETGYSVITAEHAIALLDEEGYAQRRERSGVFVIYRGEDFPGDAYQNRIKAKETVHDENTKTVVPDRKDEGFPFSVLAKTIRKVLLDQGEKILIKSPNQGCDELRNEICRYLGRTRGIEIEPFQVIIGSGAEYLYGLIAQFFGRRYSVAIEDPSYEKIGKVYGSIGMKYEMLKMRTDGISIEDLKRSKAGILHVTPFNSYPSGVTVGISKKIEYLNWAKNNNGILIEDNYDSELTVSKKPEEPLFSMDTEGRVIYINTFSGTLAPSMRIGYMILPEAMSREFEEKLGFYSCTVPVLDQYVLCELLKSGEYERHINRVRRKRRTG
ncbi:MAG: PLP-dependent aminotransferase family protein [Lachnospiraceae bacterium]|nr:PLP-dependent aminotransferase family protein [Lachnospiraceae bacterium]